MNTKTHFLAHVPQDSVCRVLCSAIELGAQEFEVSDNRGGAGTWSVAFPNNSITREHVRKIVGPGIFVEEVWL